MPKTAGERGFQLSESSQVKVLVYRTGRLARLGHNHVIAGIPRGFFALDGDQLRADIYLSLADLRVDDADLRADAGEDFQSTPSARDIAGTRANMLSEKLLNAGGYPFVRVLLESQPAAPAGAPQWQVNIQLAGADHRLQVDPQQASIEGCRITASGSFEFSHSNFGLTAYSVLGGALQVADPVLVQFDIAAVDRACRGDS